MIFLATNPPIQQVIEANILPIFVEFLSYHDDHVLQVCIIIYNYLLLLLIYKIL